MNKINNGSGIDLQIDDYATTDFNGLNTITHVKIINRIDNFRSQSKVAFQVIPKLKNSLSDAWIDAAWFEKYNKSEPTDEQNT